MPSAIFYSCFESFSAVTLVEAKPIEKKYLVTEFLALSAATAGLSGAVSANCAQ